MPPCVWVFCKNCAFASSTVVMVAVDGFSSFVTSAHRGAGNAVSVWVLFCSKCLPRTLCANCMPNVLVLLRFNFQAMNYCCLIVCGTLQFCMLNSFPLAMLFLTDFISSQSYVPVRFHFLWDFSFCLILFLRADLYLSHFSP